MDKLLFTESDSDNEGVSFKTENAYAKNYDAWRGKEELHKLEQKYGDKPLDSELEDSSDSEDESDESLEISEKMEVDFLKTLSLLKTKDPRIYDPAYNFFENDDKAKETDTEVNSKPNKQVSGLDAVFAEGDNKDESREIFKIGKKAPVTEKKEGVLKNHQTGKTDSMKYERDLAPLKAFWSDPKLNEGEAFLRDYILNKRYLEKEEAETAHGKLRDDETLEADEERMEEQGRFERAYNFRFEEPDEEYLKRFPRTMNYIRPKDEKRARKRAEARARKEEQKKRKMEEIGRLKALKLKEIQEKIAKIKEVTGNQELAFKDEDIEGDFDPEEHDRRMKAIFDQEYYEGCPDAAKPVFPDLDEELEIENWEKYEDEHIKHFNEDAEATHCEDQDFNMDADYDPAESRKNLMEEIKETLGKKRRNRKKKSKLAEILLTDKPKYVPVATDRSYADYMEEYYKMDCEDVIGGDLPTRFKYRDVVPNSFGLSIEEILLADDKDLNQWAALKKTVKYRPDNVEKGEVKTYQQKANDLKLKKKLLPSLFKEVPEEPELVVPVDNQKKEKKKKRKINSEQLESQVQHEDSIVNNEKEIDSDVPESSNIVKLDVTDENNGVKRKKKKNKHKKQTNGEKLYDENVSLKSNDIVEQDVKKEKKLKRKLILEDCSEINIKKRKTANETEINENKIFNNSNTVSKESHKKNKHKSSNTTPKKHGNKMKHSKDNKSDGAQRKKNKEKHKNKEKFKNKKQEQSNAAENPLNKLSDERLKAFGLNPKKYRGFLKYKKF